MPLYLPVKTQGTAAIAVCDRCKMKFYYDDLKQDGDSPGLRVCGKCWDEKDPWQAPARKTETINLRYPRPDEPLE